MGLLSSILLYALFSGGHSQRARRDQRTVRTSFKNLVSPINQYGTCFGCDGSGTRTFDCRVCAGAGLYTGTCRTCGGSGLFTHAAKPCFKCSGTGQFHGMHCLNCGGTGEYRSERTTQCLKCDGSGKFERTCRRCDGHGTVDLTCHKCGGSGWHKF